MLSHLFLYEALHSKTGTLQMFANTTVYVCPQYMLVSKFRDTAPILGERNILYTVAASGALPGLHLPILTLNVIRKK